MFLEKSRLKRLFTKVIQVYNPVFTTVRDAYNREKLLTIIKFSSK